MNGEILIEETFWLQSSTHKVREAIPIVEGKNYLGGTDFSIFQLEDAPEGVVVASVVRTENRLLLKCISDVLPVRVAGKLLSPGEKVPLGEKLDFVIGKHMFVFTRKFKPVETLEPGEVLKKVRTSKLPENQLELMRLVIKKVQEQINFSEIQMNQLKSPETVAGIRAKLTTVLANLGVYSEDSIDVGTLEKQVMDELIGLGPLESLLADPTITEIMVNSPTQVFTEKSGKLVLSDVAFSSEQALLAVIERIVSQVNRRIDASSPIVDARLLDGSRVNAVIPPIALKGPSLTIRRFSKKPISVEKLVEWKSMSSFTAKFLKLSVEGHLNMVISGGTGSGKTTLLNALSGFIPSHERIVTVEDAAELQLQQPHVVSLESRPANMEGKGGITIRDLVKNCLRMRPDRIVVGECRGGEALDMLQAMNTGHDGSLTTAHANTPEDMLRRLETMVLMAGVDFPLRAIREQVASAVHAIVQQTRMPSGRRLVTAVTWIHGLESNSGSYQTFPMISFEESEGSDQGSLHYNVTNMRKFAKHYNFAEAAEKLIGESGEEFATGVVL